MNKNYIVGGVIAVIIIGGLVFLGTRPKTTTAPTENATQTTGSTQTNTKPTVAYGTSEIPAPKATSKTSGRVIFTITDDAVGLDTLQSVMLTINKITVNGPKGLVTVLSAPRQYDLLDLYRTDKKQLLADLSLDAGTYNQIRISIGKITITKKGGVNSIEAKLPSTELRINTNVVVVKGKTSGIAFDFLSDKSLHTTGDGTYMFFPVVKVSSEHDISGVQTLGGNVQLFNGLTDFDKTWGMDENGVLKDNFSMNGLSKLELLGKVIHITPIDEKASDVKVDAQTVINTAITNHYIDSALSVQTVIRQGKRVWQIVGTKSGATVNVYLDITNGTVISVE